MANGRSHPGMIYGCRTPKISVVLGRSKVPYQLRSGRLSLWSFPLLLFLTRALDHAKIGEGPGGPAEMVPGQHHVRMNMYIAQAKNGNFRIVKDLGAIEPKECMQGIE